jgi:hypothetical protein
MDPVSVLGIAAAALQFVSFTASLVSGTYRIYRSKSEKAEQDGTKPKKKLYDLDEITESLKRFSDNLGSSMPVAVAGKSLTSEDAELENLCKSCSAVADQLLKVLDPIKRVDEDCGRAKLWDTFQQALSDVWNKDKIERLNKSLHSHTQAITLYMLASLRWV